MQAAEEFAMAGRPLAPLILSDDERSGGEFEPPSRKSACSGFCTNKDLASARLDARVVYHSIAFLQERSPALSARC
jgi:hypothetical protein